MNASENPRPGLRRLAYYSRNAIMGADSYLHSEIEDILVSARSRNEKAGITGILVFNNGCFVQVLEGPLAAVEETFNRIQHDYRHDNVTIIENVTTEEREFGNWSMDYVGDARAAHVFSDIFLDEPRKLRFGSNDLLDRLRGIARKKSSPLDWWDQVEVMDA